MNVCVYIYIHTHHNNKSPLSSLSLKTQEGKEKRRATNEKKARSHEKG